MRKLLAIAVIVLIAVVCGWVTFNRTPGKASVTIDTEKITNDAQQAVEKGKDLLRPESNPVSGTTTP